MDRHGGGASPSSSNSTRYGSSHTSWRRGASLDGASSHLQSRLNQFKLSGTAGAASHSVADTSIDPKSLTPEDYLDRFGMTAYVREAVNLVLENRPQAPIEFLNEYFRNAVQGSSYLHRAYRFVRMTDRDRPEFLGNVAKAHHVLSRRKGSVGVTGEEMNKLLSLLCHDFPTEISEIVMGTLRKYFDPGEIIEFDRFFLCIRVCLLFEEQVEFAQQYFESLCMANAMPEGLDKGSGSSSGSSGSRQDSLSSLKSSPHDNSTGSSSNATSPSNESVAKSNAFLRAREPLPRNMPLDERTDVEHLINYLHGTSNGQYSFLSGAKDGKEFKELETHLRKAASSHPSGRISLSEFVNAFASHLTAVAGMP